jgi:hypothetical protein
METGDASLSYETVYVHPYLFRADTFFGGGNLNDRAEEDGR